jgi:hypothetical protein
MRKRQPKAQAGLDGDKLRDQQSKQTPPKTVMQKWPNPSYPSKDPLQPNVGQTMP